MQGIDAKGYLTGWLNALVDMTSKDIRAFSAEKWTETFGGCTRPASALMADTISLLYWTTEALKGNVISDSGPETMDSVMAQCSTPQATIELLKKSADEFNAALMNASDDKLNSMVMPPWQMEAPLYMLANIAVSHVWYHDGQLNYIQCLLGDDKVHWMDEA